MKIDKTSEGSSEASLITGKDDERLERALSMASGRSECVRICYEIRREDTGIEVLTSWSDEKGVAPESIEHWNRFARCDLFDPKLNHLFLAAEYQLSSLIESTGIMDGSVWQYNLEWVRDQSMVVWSLVLMGDFETARTML
ncbi:MAG: hypothetical protein ACYTG7_14015, partial [Planctomycetota bacterium]